MKSFAKSLSLFLLVALCVSVFSPLLSAASQKVMILDGQNNHNWKAVTPVVKIILEDTGIFKVDVVTSPPRGKAMDNFKPTFTGYDVIVTNYNGAEWPEETKAAFVNYVKNGGGLVVVHAADNSFSNWKEYNEIIGLGGWGGRNEKSGPYVYWKDGKVVRDTTPGSGGTHGPYRKYLVTIRKSDHPITAGLPTKWLHGPDEMYAKMRGPARNLEVLATGLSKVSRRHEPLLFTVTYGSGRIFHTVLGHDPHGLKSIGCAVTLQRGTEWAATGKVTQKLPAQFSTEKKVVIWVPTKVFQDILTYRFGHSRKSLIYVESLIQGASPAGHEAIEQKLLEAFSSPESTYECKQFVCQMLYRVGTEKAVAVLAPYLADKKLSDMVRFALERMPVDAVDNVLLSALGKTSGNVRIGIINSLGERGRCKAAGSLGRLALNKDKNTAIAAIVAMGKIGCPSCIANLQKMQSHIPANLHNIWADAYLECADKLVARGVIDKAESIYQQLYTKSDSKAIVTAAFRGLVNVRKEKAPQLIVEALQKKDENIQEVAAGTIREIPGEKATLLFVESLPKLSDNAKVLLLNALGIRRDKLARSAVQAQVSSSELKVKLAAINALASIGDSASVDLLAQTAAESKGSAKPARDAARNCLNRLRGKDVNKYMIGKLRSAPAEIKIELIISLAARNARQAGNVILKAADDSNLKVKVESLKALRELATGNDTAALVALLVKARNNLVRHEAEKAVAAAAKKIKDVNSRADALLSVLNSVDDQAKVSLIKVLGSIANQKALQALKDNIKATNRDVQDAVIRGLAAWPNDKPAELLLATAHNTNNKTQKIMALRGYIYLAGRATNRSLAEQLNMFRNAAKLSERKAEKKQVIAGLAKICSMEALDMVLSYRANSDLKVEADLAAISIAAVVYGSDTEKVKGILNKIMTESEDKNVRKQAQDIIKNIEKHEGYITSWDVSGPYFQKGKSEFDLLDIAFAPEKDQKSEWQVMGTATSSGHPYIMMLDKVLGGNDRVAYLRSNIYSPKQQPARLEMGSDDGLKVWLNGKVVHNLNAGRGCSPGQDKVNITLQKGWNSLLLKVSQGRGGWAACARICNSQGGKLDGLKIRAKK